MLGCSRNCGFLVVEDDYFERKRRFNPAVCPNCHAGRVLVLKDDLTPDVTRRLEVRMGEKTQGKVVDV